MANPGNPFASGRVGAGGGASVGVAGAPILRSSCRAMASLRPPGMPVIFCATWVSSISVPICVPALSSMPEDSVAWRMLFISSCMNSASNCLAASLMAPLGSRAALARNASMPRWSGPVFGVAPRFDAITIRSPPARH